MVRKADRHSIGIGVDSCVVLHDKGYIRNDTGLDEYYHFFRDGGTSLLDRNEDFKATQYKLPIPQGSIVDFVVNRIGVCGIDLCSAAYSAV